MGPDPVCAILLGVRAVAQPGSALAWGARGREFESRRPDQNRLPPSLIPGLSLSLQ